MVESFVASVVILQWTSILILVIHLILSKLVSWDQFDPLEIDRTYISIHLSLLHV
jgi:hypothetical protein